jgi:hypothetical protein
MTRFAKFMLVAVAFAAVLAVGSGMLLAYGLAHVGLVKVEVRERAHAGRFDLSLPVPAGLLARAIDLAALAGPSDGCRHPTPRAWHAWRPAVRAACRALARSPDGVLVTVESGPETVRIVKRRHVVEIQVHGPQGDVRVITPAGLVWHFADVV